jgi:hypothetical protein
MSKQNIQWAKQPEKQDYPAAESFLNLIYGRRATEKLVKRLRSSTVREFKAKDIFRASGLPLLNSSNVHVRTDLAKLLNGEKVSPLLLVRESKLGKIIIADGYHRMCAVYSVDEDAYIRCKIVSA